MGRVDGKVALITGGARGQGRAHALRLAGEGADVVVLDLGKQIGTVPYELSEASELETTAGLVEALGRRALAFEVDVRDRLALDHAVAVTLERLGRLDIVCANAGILPTGMVLETPDGQWQDTLDINLTGVWNTIRATTPALIDQAGGSIIVTNSVAGLRGGSNCAAYVTSKHALVGLVRACAHEFGRHSIRVNGIHPTSVATPMVHNDAMSRALRPDLEAPTIEDTIAVRQSNHLLPIPWIDPIDVSNAVLWLASDEARYVTGVCLPVDAGASIR
jgi:SDR family mycofactocin-dependent oxidoreductase